MPRTSDLSRRTIVRLALLSLLLLAAGVADWCAVFPDAGSAVMAATPARTRSSARTRTPAKSEASSRTEAPARTESSSRTEAPAVGEGPVHPGEVDDFADESAVHGMTPEGEAQLERIRHELDQNLDKIMNAYLAEQGSDKARADIGVILGAFLEIGRFGEPDFKRAMDFYKTASRLGSAEADCALGNLYQYGARDERGHSIERNPSLARQCYERAAAGGSVRAMLELGAIYTEGRDLDPDPKKGLPYFVQAASRANEDAILRLKPVMDKAREWEIAHPGKKAGFPTSREEIVDKNLVKEYIDVNFELERLASRVYVEVSKRIAATIKPTK